MISGVKKQGNLAFKSFCSKFINTPPVLKKPTIKSTSISAGSTFTPSDHSLKTKVNYLVKRKGGVADLMALVPVLKQLKYERGYDIYVATNNQDIFKGLDFISGTVSWNEKIAGIGKRIDLDSVEFKDPLNHIINVFSKAVIGHMDFVKDYILNENEEDCAKVNEIIHENNLNKGDYIVLHEGVGNKNRVWPKSKWNTLEALLLAQGNQVVVVGSGSDNKPSMPKCVDMVNKLSFHEIKVLIEMAGAFVGIDDYAMAIAGATNTPIFGLFFSTEGSLRFPYRNGEMGNNCFSIAPNIDCFGCWHKNGNPRVYHGCIHGHFKCKDLVTPKMVLGRVNSK
jgi:ADP-heptose:LPS heptosyltransferase